MKLHVHAFVEGAFHGMVLGYVIFCVLRLLL
jgi:hypothetical protein